MPLVPISLPQLGESIAEGTIVSVLIGIGDSVEADQDLFEVETQKATMGVPALCSGKIVSIAAAAMQTYPVGEVLAYIEATDEEIRRTGVRTVDQKPASNAASAAPTTTSGPRKVEPVVHGLPVPAHATGASYISPRMRARMEELGLNAADLASIAGTGAGGRVTVRDFENFLSELDQKTITPASTMRVAVADSMRRSWTRPLATVGVPVSLDKLLAHRAKHSAPKPGPALYALRAFAMALGENPALGGRLVGRRIVHPDAIDIGFAVEVEDGVMVPVIRSADQRNLDALLEPYAELVEKARARKLTADESKPGIATVTNYGTFGILWASPIPLPEQNLVLGLGAAAKRPRWDATKEAFVPVTEAVLTLSFDHRILDGGGAGRLLDRIASLLQTPEAL
ncbi:MAG: dihydrolipoamide acetyltransferase family protein [Verrucomicrobiales bacterium]